MQDGLWRRVKIKGKCNEMSEYVPQKQPIAMTLKKKKTHVYI